MENEVMLCERMYFDESKLDFICLKKNESTTGLRYILANAQLYC
jgi:hypothetical protein